ncbi:heme peroxidase [Metapseudomonas lalkuanensis]|uniref:Heme peroxidase n=1 Tax=Metapseudomonas lalkuanensis TaxID=2604832 RepID=A0A5J6QH11_9GAMM|nr:peroxidase family protein [Pseudomonas lalkuanensis]QEY62028.1 heme peroxidase [Pseudomonas lalkuanensis]
MANFILSDLEFILQQILIAEAHAAGEELSSLVPNTQVPWGLRTLDGSFNHLLGGQETVGAADELFPRMLEPVFRPAEGGTSYLGSGTVIDSQPRTISNLIVDQTISNPAAVQTFVDAGFGVLADGTQLDPAGVPFPVGTLLDLAGVPVPAGQSLFLPNTTPDEGLSAPFNTWFTFFGQFFDHGLDLVTKGGNEVVFIPLQEDDPLFVQGSPTNFLVLTRATQFAGPGADGVVGTADDTQETQNTTSPFVDQNQTYSSHPSHQVFLRAYELNANGDPVSTGRLITNRDLGLDGRFGTADDVELGGMATWAVVKAQARDILGIELTDADVGSVPLLATDAYGNFIKGPNGFPQVVFPGNVLVEGNPAAPISLVGAIRTGHAFLDDIAHSANPFNSQTGALLGVDADAVAGVDDGNAATYDNELLDAHYIAGDGRANENIGLTAVHHVFHAEHNRLVEHTKEVILASGDLAFLNQWLLTPVGAVPATPDGLNWNGERLFQAAKFGTEMQYQHLVFEEFARKVQPAVDAFLAPNGFDATINPAIVAEFAHTVYRFGHSMLTETIDRLDPNFASSEIGLITAFLNPLAFAASGATAEAAAGAIIRGTTRQEGNEIDEFVTEALRNNLLGLPLDLATINIARGRDTGIPSLNAARREFHAMTGDSQLTAYTSWVDFMGNLKHETSLINFIAAYGTHATITGATTLEAKRAAAMAIVLGTGANVPADRLDFLNSTGAWASGANGVTTTGLDLVDFWIGGLAEKQMPFGGLLGSTFNFVFETQLEALQNGDRFYYLGRLAGLNFLTEMENNSFAKMVMENTDITRLPADIFSTPAWILEVNQLAQHTGLNEAGADGIQGTADDVVGADGIAGNSDPLGDNPLLGLVVRDNPDTVGPDTNYLRYTGEDHVVLGGTAGDDILIASIGDDTLWGDAGNDRLEGGDGVDNLDGGAGDDIITDLGGDDNIKGGEGNDVIQAGNGFNLILGGGGSDFIITGEDVSETFGGTGNDFIYGAKGNLQTAGNEGDDWIEIGTQDGAPGDNFSPFARDEVPGNDVFVGGGGFDEVIGEGGDDIMVGSEGSDHFDGMSGWDWATYRGDPRGVNVDLLVNDLVEPPVPASNAGLLDRFAEVEGLSGSSFSDILKGDHADATTIPTDGELGSTLTNIALVNGLQGLLDEAFGPGVVSFSAGNILLGGAGSDIIEGRGGNDLIDGDRWLNVRVQVTGNANVTTVLSIQELIPRMLSGEINPSQLSIVREILDTDDSIDTAVFGGDRANYTVTTVGGVTTVTDNVGTEGSDTLLNIERLQFADQTLVLGGANSLPTGQLSILDASSGLVDNTPSVGQLLRASVAGVTDADNDGGTLNGRPITFIWQVETIAGSGIFQDIVTEGGDVPATAARGTFRVTAEQNGLAIRVKAIYQDDEGVLETAFSAPTADVAGVVVPTTPAAIPAESPTEPINGGVHLIRGDLQFILDQIKIAERHSAGESLLDILPNTRGAFGLRTVDGSFNNLVPGQEHFGAADQPFPNLLDQFFRNEGDEAPFAGVDNSNYATSGPGGSVVDSDPRTISNLVVDQTITNPAAVKAFLDAGLGTQAVDALGNPQFNPDGTPIILDAGGVVIPRGQPLVIPNTAPDEGLSAGFNSWFTLFGQFFDHGLDLVSKGGNGLVFIPLQPDDPLITHGRDGIAGNGDEVLPQNAFMVMTRASTTAVQAGTDGQLGTSDDIHVHVNQTTPFVDQNQTYTSHPSHQVFLREYVLDANGRPVATGRMLDGINPDGSSGGLPTWADVKAQASAMLGIELDDQDVLNLPLIATDAYGKFIPDPDTGFAQIVTAGGLQSGTPAAPIDASLAGRTGHAFLDDIAHSANPFGDHDNNPATPSQALVADADNVAGPNDGLAGTYDDELLNEHFITGDGRGNENIGLTAVHHVFHAEHNRMVEHIKAVVLASNDPDFIAEWQLSPGVWDGERLFQAARFTTEMQYQHLVFEEFARKVQPQVDVFFAPTQVYDTNINPAIVAEFAHVVYRFGHSMLTETVDRFDPTFANDSSMGLIAAFLNPLAFNQLSDGAGGTVLVSADQAAGAIVRGMTRQLGNEIDEFVTEALRNNLLGLPLDLPSINLARGRDTGVPTLNMARQEFFNATGDTQLKPYSSWLDFAMNLKHQESVVNFIAAYGTHASITGATTMADKRAAAVLLVFGGDGAPADRLEFLNGPAATTGVNDIDLWIGGLAERQMPFGGLLGSTFNFVFENQMEKLQDGDRFYYLERTAGLNFLTELENNSFAKLVMANTDALHLPGDIFSTPAFTLEVNQAAQHTGLGLSGRDDPTGTNPLLPLVGRGEGLLVYRGEDHVVLGGTAGNDRLISSIGDDTLHGDAGNDRLEGGDGNDFLFGGAGDDIITDRGGDDNIQGGEGNDVLHSGNGVDLIIGGFGNDFMIKLEDESEFFGGVGNDFILAGRANEFSFGNEGDDWIQHGMADGAAGDNFDAFGNDPIIGHDVFYGEFGIIDRMDGEGGDDIMMGNGGEGDRYVGMSGFDWAVFRDDPAGVNVDMRLRAFNEAPIAPSVASVLSRFESTEGMSGSRFSDMLRGDDADATAIATQGAYGSVLTNISLITGMQEFLGAGVTSYGAGNIILGGNGSDLLIGGGGDDLIDGDKSLNARISIRDGAGVEIGTANSLTGVITNKSGALAGTAANLTLASAALSGLVNPGQMVIVRELVNGTGFNYDTAVFTGNFDEYQVNIDNRGTTLDFSDDIITVTDTVDGRDGVDRLTGIERLQFADQALAAVPGLNSGPTGLATVSDTTPEVGTLLRASIAGVTDADNAGGAITGPVAYYWQVDDGDGVFVDIETLNAGGDADVAAGPTFRVTADLAGQSLRLKAIYKDRNGVLETVYSAGTALVSGTQVNDVPTGAPVITGASFFQGVALTATRGTIADADGTATSVFSFQWQSSTNGTVWNNVLGANTANFTPGAAQVGQMLRVLVSYTDDQGFANQVASAATAFVGGLFTGGAGNDTLIGAAGDDVMNGGAGNDTLSGGAGNDILNGGTGADSMSGGTGNDTFYVDNVLDSVNEAAGAGVDMVRTTLASYNLGANVENLAYIGSSNFTAVGNGLANVIAGAVGNDTLSGGGGDDTLVGVDGNDVLNGNTGADRMVGGVGDDTFYVDNVLDTVVESAGSGSDMVRTTLSSYTLGANLEILVSLGGGAFTGTGNALGNRLVGGAGTDTLDGLAGNDILQGLAGNDVLNGGADADTMIGGSGNDTYYVDNALDFVAEAIGGGTDVVRTTLSSYSLGTNVENLVFIGSGVFSGTGNTLANRIQGGSDDDTLSGLSGNDILVGGAGNDTMDGGVGNDIFQFGAGFGQDRILGFDAIQAGGQDRLHIADLGITAATFAGSVVIAGVGADTQVTIGANSITLVGVVSADVTQADFIVS